MEKDGGNQCFCHNLKCIRRCILIKLIFHFLFASPGSHVLSPSKPPSKTCEVDQIPPKHLHKIQGTLFPFRCARGVASTANLPQAPSTKNNDMRSDESTESTSMVSQVYLFQDWWMMLAPAKFRYLVTLPSKDGWILQTFKHFGCILGGIIKH